MAPTTTALIKALEAEVTRVWKVDQDNLTVRRVRDAVEQNLDLDSGFFQDAKWKDKSKEVIKAKVVRGSFIRSMHLIFLYIHMFYRHYCAGLT